MNKSHWYGGVRLWRGVLGRGGLDAKGEVRREWGGVENEKRKSNKKKKKYQGVQNRKQGLWGGFFVLVGGVVWKGARKQLVSRGGQRARKGVAEPTLKIHVHVRGGDRGHPQTKRNKKKSLKKNKM